MDKNDDFLQNKIKVVFLNEDFCKLYDWKTLKLSTRSKRPHIIVNISNEKSPNYFVCIPFSKDDDKNEKFSKAIEKNPQYYHKIKINKLKSFLLIKNLFIIRKEFIGRDYEVFDKAIAITDENTINEINKKIKKVYTLIKYKTINYVDIEEVLKIQNDHFDKK